MLRRIFPRFAFLRVSGPLLPTASRLSVAPRPLGSPRLSSFFPIRFASYPSSSSSSASQPQHTLPPGATMTQRLKHLMKVYGWYALGVYFVIGVVDFSVAFVGINLLGAEYVARFTASVREMADGLLNVVWQSRPTEPGREEMESVSHPDGMPEGLAAMLVLAYTVHKTLFLPVRVGLTAALTPRLVNWLSQRGWSGGEGTKRAAQAMRARISSGKNSK